VDLDLDCEDSDKSMESMEGSVLVDDRRRFWKWSVTFAGVPRSLWVE